MSGSTTGKVVYSVGKEGPKPFEKGLENFKAAPATPRVAADEPTKVPVQTDPVNGKPASVPVAVLPDLNGIVVPEVNPEALAKVAQEAADRKAWAEAAGAKLTQIRERISKLEAADSKFSPVAQQALGQLKAAEQQIVAAMGEGALKEHVEFAQLLGEVRAINPEHTGEVHAAITRLIQMGRYRLATETEIETGKATKWPPGAIFFEGRVYYSVHKGMASAGQRALEAELRKLVDAAKLSKASAMKSRGNADIAGLTCERPRPGMYYLYSPKREVPQDGGPPLKFSEGHLLLELVDRNKGKRDARPHLVVEVREGEGSLRSLADRSQGRAAIPYYWLEAGFVIPPKDRETGRPRRLLDDEFRRALRIVKTIRAICAISGHPFPEQKKPEAPAPAEKAAETPTPAPALPLEQVLA